MWQTPTIWPHLQQFLHCMTSRFMLALCTVEMKLPMLKHLLIIFLALDLLWVSHKLIQMMVILDLGETLIILGLDARIISLKTWLDLRMFLTSLEEILVFDCSLIKDILTILRYNLDCRCQVHKRWTWFLSILFFIFISFYFLIFLFLEQLGLGSEGIGHTVTSVTIW